LPSALDGCHHQVPHVVAGDAARGGEEAHGFPATAIERESNPQPLAIVAADIEAIGAPTAIALIDRNAAVMPPLQQKVQIVQGTIGLLRPPLRWRPRSSDMIGAAAASRIE
jgi:hypothetical protein